VSFAQHRDGLPTALDIDDHVDVQSGRGLLLTPGVGGAREEDRTHHEADLVADGTQLRTWHGDNQRDGACATV